MTPHNWEHSRPTHVPAHIRRAALERDAHQCTAPLQDGTRCEETTRLEAHELVQWYEGRVVRLEDVTMLCHWHHNRITQRQAAAARKPRTTMRPTEKHPGLR